MENCVIKHTFNKMLMANADGVNIWNQVFKFIIENKEHFNHAKEIEFIIQSMGHNLLFHRCKDSKTVLRVLNMYQRWLGICKIPPSAARPIDYILEPLNSLNFVNSRHLYDWDELLTGIDVGSVNYVKLLVKYGKISENNRFFDTTTANLYLLIFMHYVMSHMIHREINYYSCWKPATDIMYTMLRTNGKVGNNQRGFARIIIILRILNNLIMKREYNTKAKSSIIKNRIQCLKMYYTAINEPFISQDEIKDFLKLLFAKDDKCENVVEEMISIYQEIFHAENTLVYEPRTLKHQSRCAVRKQLSQQDKSLPNLISQLKVPLVIEELLLGAPEFIT